MYFFGATRLLQIRSMKNPVFFWQKKAFLKHFVAFFQIFAFRERKLGFDRIAHLTIFF